MIVAFFQTLVAASLAARLVAKYRADYAYMVENLYIMDEWTHPDDLTVEEVEGWVEDHLAMREKAPNGFYKASLYLQGELADSSVDFRPHLLEIAQDKDGIQALSGERVEISEATEDEIFEYVCGKMVDDVDEALAYADEMDFQRGWDDYSEQGWEEIQPL